MTQHDPPWRCVASFEPRGTAIGAIPRSIAAKDLRDQIGVL